VLSHYPWNINVRKKAINDKLQGNVAIYLRCSGVVKKQSKKCLLLSLAVNFYKYVNIWQCCKQGRRCLFTDRLSIKPFLIWLLKPHHTLNTLFCNLSLIACFLTIMFDNVVWQHTQGVVGFSVITLLQIYRGVLQWNFFRSRLGFHGIMTASLWSHFLAHAVFLFPVQLVFKRGLANGIRRMRTGAGEQRLTMPLNYWNIACLLLEKQCETVA